MEKKFEKTKVNPVYKTLGKYLDLWLRFKLVFVVDTQEIIK